MCDAGAKLNADARGSAAPRSEGRRSRRCHTAPGRSSTEWPSAAYRWLRCCSSAVALPSVHPEHHFTNPQASPKEPLMSAKLYLLDAQVPFPSIYSHRGPRSCDSCLLGSTAAGPAPEGAAGSDAAAHAAETAAANPAFGGGVATAAQVPANAADLLWPAFSIMGRAYLQRCKHLVVYAWHIAYECRQRIAFLC